MNGKLNRLNSQKWEWRSQNLEGKEMLVEIYINNDNLVYFSDGHSDQSIRGHLVMSGTQYLQDFITKPYPWIKDYPRILKAINGDFKRILKSLSD